MKKYYDPKVEIIYFENADLVTASGEYANDNFVGINDNWFSGGNWSTNTGN